MKASLLFRAAPIAILAAALAGGGATAAFAQTTSTIPPSAGSQMGGSQMGSATPQPGSLTRNMPDNGALTSNASATQQATTGGETQNAATTAPSRTLEQMADQRIIQLRSELHITPKEQPAWSQFASVMRDNAKDLDQAYQQRAEQLDTMNAVQNIQSYAQIEQTRAQDIQKLAQAFQSLYTSLTPSQQHEADALFRSRAEAAQQRHQAAAQQTR